MTNLDDLDAICLAWLRTSEVEDTAAMRQHLLKMIERLRKSVATLLQQLNNAVRGLRVPQNYEEFELQIAAARTLFKQIDRVRKEAANAAGGEG